MKIIIKTESISVIKALSVFDVEFIFVEPLFSYQHPFIQTLDDLNQRLTFLKGKPFYLNINAYIEDYQLDALKMSLNDYIQLKPKGFYFADFAIYQLLKELGYQGELIYAPETILTNSSDTSFYLKYVERCLIAKELTLNEILEISNKHSHKIEVFALGYAMMSVSKRPLVQNYMDELQRSDKLLNRLDLRIQEEKRTEWMPILEEKGATSIYLPTITYSKNQMNAMSEAKVHSIICDSLFINDDDFIELFKHLLDLNPSFTFEDLAHRLPLGEAYYYRKTNLLKGDKS